MVQRGEKVRPQRWSRVIDLFDDGEYSAIWGSFDDENGGIHPDERNLVHMIRHLPQGMDMSLFVLD